MSPATAFTLGMFAGLALWLLCGAVMVALVCWSASRDESPESAEDLILREFRHLPQSAHLDIKKAFEAGRRAR